MSTSGPASPNRIRSSRLPGRLGRLAEAQGGPAAVAFLLLIVILPVAGLGVWSIPAAFGAALLVLVGELWLDTRALREQLRDSESGLDAARREFERLQPFETRTQVLEGEKIELQDTVRSLRERIAAPVSLQELLGGVAAHANLAALVERHRELDPGGETGYPATEVRLADDGVSVRVGALMGAAASQALGERVVLSRGGEGLAEGVTTGSSGELLLSTFPLHGLPEGAASELQAAGTVSPDGYRVVLAGFVDSSYARLADGELTEIRAVYESLTALVVRVVYRSGRPEEGQEER